MIKVTFNKKQSVFVNGLKQECNFIYTLKPILFHKDFILISQGKDDEFCAIISNIKSIEHVKPTEL